MSVNVSKPTAQTKETKPKHETFQDHYVLFKKNYSKIFGFG